MDATVIKAFYTTTELAKLSSRSAQVVRRWANNGWIPSFRIGGSRSIYVAMNKLESRYPALAKSYRRAAELNTILGHEQVQALYTLGELASSTGIPQERIKYLADNDHIKTFCFRPGAMRYVLFADLEEANPDFCNHFVEATQLSQSS